MRPTIFNTKGINEFFKSVQLEVLKDPYNANSIVSGANRQLTSLYCVGDDTFIQLHRTNELTKALLIGVESTNLFFKAINYQFDNERFLTEKSGADIKFQITQTMADYHKKMSLYIDDMKSLINDIGVIPGDNCNDYKWRDCSLVVPNLPKRFSWDQIRTHDDSSMNKTYSLHVSEDCSAPYISEQPAMPQQLNVKINLQRYNDYCEKYCDMAFDCKIMETIYRNISDTKTYNLTLSQLVALSF
jgi:hypothetical protein